MTTPVINGEECRLVKGFERYYLSESGKVYRHKALNSVEQAIIDEGAQYVNKCEWHYRRRSRGLSQPFCSLTSAEGKLVLRSVARFMAETYEIEGGIFDNEEHSIIFADGDNQNLHYTNLKLIEKRKNNGKLTKTHVKEIKKQIRQNVPLNKIAAQFDVSDMQINRIKTGENWGNGKRKIKAPTAPFHVEDGKIRRYIATFEQKETNPNIRKPFAIKRNPEDPTDNLIVGILKGYKLSLKHRNITRAQVNIKKLNDYFF